MMASANIQQGWTDTSDTYPSYINLTLDDDDVVVTVRAPAQDRVAGAQASARLPRATLVLMVTELLGRAAARAIADLDAAAAARLA